MASSPRQYNTFREIDLHEHTEAVARRVLCEALDALRRTAPGCMVRVITGAGHRSRGRPVLVAMVRQLLERGLPQVASWELGGDAGSFVVRIAGRARNGARTVDRGAVDARAWFNERQLEYARRQAIRREAAERHEAKERERINALKRDYGVHELPDWLAGPPADLVR